ncbi:MAG: VUT family protein, partial [Propionibacteriales bacterium]|nr:VUT family protein [Propionibacteriales bacterium]
MNPDPVVRYARLPRSHYPTILALFVATLIISNVAASKGVSFFGDTALSLGSLQILPINTDGAF